MYKWFHTDELHTVSELRKCYRELLKRHHPDNGGNAESMKEINAEYDALFRDLSRNTDADGQDYTCEENEHFKAVLNKIAGFNMTIEIIGSWLWCFDSYPYRKQLKELGFHYAASKKAWVWHDDEYRRFGRKEMPLSSIRAKYGSHKIKNQRYQYSLE